MAEKQVDATGDVVANRPTPGDVVVEGSVEDLIRNAPEPSSGAKKVFAVQYPTDRFVMAGMPVIDTAGVPLTDAQAKELLPVAEASGVRIVEVQR